MSEQSDLIDRIFEMVESKRAEKPKRKKKEMTPEARERMLANLKKGRETSLAKRRAKKSDKEPTTPKPQVSESQKPSVERPPTPTPALAQVVEPEPPKMEPIMEAPTPALKPTPAPAPAPAPVRVAPAPQPVAPPPEPFSMSTYGNSGSFW